MFPKKILFAVHHYPPRRMGGAELLTRRLAQRLAAAGTAVRVIYIDSVERGKQTTVAESQEQDGSVSLRRLQLTIEKGKDPRLLYDTHALQEVFSNGISEWHPDLVHVVSGYLMGLAPLLAARAHRVPSVVTLTDFWFLCPTIQLLKGDMSLCSGPQVSECLRCLYDDKRIFHALDRHTPGLAKGFWSLAPSNPLLGRTAGIAGRARELEARRADLIQALNQTDAIISLTEFVADLHVANGVDRDKIIVKPDCLDMKEFEAAETGGSRPAGVHFGYLGQIMPIKGVDVLVRAITELERSTAKPIYLHIHGTANASDRYLESLKKLASGRPNIIFHGPYEHRKALTLLGQLDALIVPSLWYENSPRVVLEAFAARIPVIGSRVGGIAEVVQDNLNGLLFERGDVSDLAQVLRRVVDEPDLLGRLRHAIPPPRTLENDMRDMIEIYKRVLEGHG